MTFCGKTNIHEIVFANSHTTKALHCQFLETALFPAAVSSPQAIKTETKVKEEQEKDTNQGAARWGWMRLKGFLFNNTNFSLQLCSLVLHCFEVKNINTGANLGPHYRNLLVIFARACEGLRAR